MTSLARSHVGSLTVSFSDSGLLYCQSFWCTCTTMTFTELTSVPGTPCAPTLSSKAGSSFGGSHSSAEQLQLASYEAGDAAEPAAKRRKAGQFMCPKCASWKQVSEADKTRPSTCVKCVNSHAGMQRRWANDRKLKVWFDAMDNDKK